MLLHSFARLWVLVLGRTALCFFLRDGQGLRSSGSSQALITDQRARTEVVSLSSSSVCLPPLFSSEVRDHQIDRQWVPNQICLCTPITPCTLLYGGEHPDPMIIPRARSPPGCRVPLSQSWLASARFLRTV